MAGVGVLGGASGVLAAEVCAPLLLLCWLCCWPDDDRSDTSSEMHPQKPVVISNESSSRHRSNELFGRRFGSSAVSLHMPSTSGQSKQPLSAHRSHEEIRGRRKSHLDPNEQETRFHHSAPSVIDEVLHRRDWERSTKELYIPLKSDNEFSNTSDISDKSDNDDSPKGKSDEQIVSKPCKKHHTNIKSSRKKQVNKESMNDDVKDQDVTETTTNFYIGESSSATSPEYTNEIKVDDSPKSVNKPKEAKQNLNELIKSKDRQRPLVPLTEYQVAGFGVEPLDEMGVDRSGAVHHSVESRSSLYNTPSIPAPPPSVEAVGYEWEASYLEETGTAGVWRAPAPTPPAVMAPVGWLRARHASAGDVLAPVIRPQSGALSESDLDFELEGCDEAPPAYEEVQLVASLDRKETAI